MNLPNTNLSGLPLNLRDLPSTGLSVFENPEVNLATTFARQLDQISLQGSTQGLLEDINGILRRGRMKDLEDLSKLGEANVVGPLLALDHAPVMQEIRRRLSLAIPVFDDLMEGIKRGRSLIRACDGFRPLEVSEAEVAPY